MALYLGLMSGTSIDGIDAALLEIDDAGMRLLAAICRDWPPTIQRRLRRLAEDYQHIGLVELGPRLRRRQIDLELLARYSTLDRGESRMDRFVDHGFRDEGPE